VRIVVVVLLLLASIAHADRLDEAKRLEAQLEFEPALVIVEKLIADGNNGLDRFVELHLFAGKLAAGLDRREVAEAHFAIVLSVAPTTTLPEGISPKIALPFAAARAHTGPLVISNSGRVERDPLNLVATLRPDPHLIAFDIHNNVVWIGPEASRDPMHFSDAIVPSPETDRQTKRTTILLGAALATYVVTGIAMWRFNVAQNEFDELKASGMADYTELQSIEQRGRRWSYAANGGVAASLIATVLVVVW
jgi:hypothetical protein